MAKLKDNNNAKISVHKNNESESRSKYCFDFLYLTNNNSYNFDFFKKDATNKLKAYCLFIQKLKELSSESIELIQQKCKADGLETIPYKSFKESFKGILDTSKIVTKDSKLIVFRFNKVYRIICKNDMHTSNLLHILGFDFDFAAYNHGA